MNRGSSDTIKKSQCVCVGEGGLYGNFASEYEASSQWQSVVCGVGVSFQKSGRLEKTV